MPKVFIVGASSGVGEHLARRYAREGWRLAIAGRDARGLAAVAQDLRIRCGAEVSEVPFDAAEPAGAAAAASAAVEGGAPDLVVFTVGANAGSHGAWDAAEIRRTLGVNFEGIAALTAVLLPALEGRPGTALAFVSSVAGDRGRRNNFVYGAAKAALNVYAQGLRARLHRSGVSVTTIKLGYVDTRLSYGRVPAWAAASPESAARSIQRAVEARRDVVYVPWFWRWILLAVRCIPEWLFKRLDLP